MDIKDNLGMVFPGQGSQSVGMLAVLADSHPIVKDTFDEASEELSINLWKLTQNGPEDHLNHTENTQPAMLAAGIAVYRLWLHQGGPLPAALAGHSLGEYSALTAAGALPFADAVKLVAARGRFMQQAVPAGVGAMAAILGLEDDQVRAVCEAAAAGQVAQAVNFNSPGQVVIAGDRAAIERAVKLAPEAGAKRALMLPVSVPSHCDLMKPAAQQLERMLGEMTIQMPSIEVIHNVDVSVSITPDDIRQKLVQQLYQPVRWVETIQAMVSQGVSSVVEAGPGKVLTGLNKRIDRKINSLPVADPAGLEKALEAVNA
jgi:[acyl-carrier-protein] S-malonyltransferase